MIRLLTGPICFNFAKKLLAYEKNTSRTIRALRSIFLSIILFSGKYQMPVDTLCNFCFADLLKRFI